MDIKRLSTDSKRGRKRALSTTGLAKNLKIPNTQKVIAVGPKPKLVKGKGKNVVKFMRLPIIIYISMR